MKDDLHVHESALWIMENELECQHDARRYWTGIQNVIKYNWTPNSASHIQYTAVSDDIHAVEDYVKHLDISKATKNLVYEGTDPGIKTMSVTVALTYDEIVVHTNRYSKLFSKLN